MTAVAVPTPPEGWRGVYLKSRERTAGDFPMVSVAFGCAVAGGKMQHVRMVLGGVAPAPLPCPEAEALLEGSAPAPALWEGAVEAAFAEATPLAHNGFKVELGRNLVRKALEQVLQ